MPSLGTKNELRQLVDYITSGFLKKFNGSLGRKQINNVTLDFDVEVVFETNEDRTNAIKYLKNNINTAYIRNVKSY